MINSMGTSETTRNGLAVLTYLNAFMIFPTAAAPEIAKMEPISAKVFLVACDKTRCYFDAVTKPCESELNCSLIFAMARGRAKHPHGARFRSHEEIELKTM